LVIVNIYGTKHREWIRLTLLQGQSPEIGRTRSVDSVFSYLNHAVCPALLILGQAANAFCYMLYPLKSRRLMTPLVLGEHTYDIIEGDDEKPTRVRVSRVDKGPIDVDIEEVMGKLSWIFPSDKFRLRPSLPDPSNEEISVSVSLTQSERINRGGRLMERIVVRSSEVEARLKQMPSRLD